MSSLATLPAFSGIGSFGSLAPQRPAGLSPRQKAAIVVRLVLQQGGSLALTNLSEDMQASLTEEIARMRSIDHETLAAVADEFSDQLETIGLSFHGGMENALSLLDGQLSPSVTSRLRRLAGGGQSNPWERISGLDSAMLLRVLEEESIEVGAVMLSMLAVSKAADLLGKLPGEKARRIAYAVSLTGNVAPETVRKIGLSLSSQLDAQPVKAFDIGPVERVGAILNFSTAPTRDDVLLGLDEVDAAFAEQVRRAIFTFTNIAKRIDARDVPKIIRNVDQTSLIKALAGATGADEKSGEYILANISQRMAASLRDEVANIGKLKEKDAEEAKSAVVAAIREMEAAGELFLIAGDEDEAAQE